MPNPDTDPRIPTPVSAPSLPTFDYERLEGREPIGRGGDAEVYLSTVTHRGERYPVAVKEPRFEGTVHERLLESFRSEAETWSTIDDHENVVTVHAWDVTPVPWIGLEYVDGGTLERRLGTADLPEALWLGGCVADGVHHGHRHGVAHLDIKPANVLLCETGGGTWDYPKVSDWGLARPLLDDSDGVEGFSRRFAAPEQFAPDRFGDPNDRTNIYQLGALVYALLTGVSPVESASVGELVRERPDPPSAVASGVPAAVDDAVLRALEPEPEDRYETAVGFRQELDRLFESVVAGGTSRGGTAGPAEPGAGADTATNADDPAAAGGHDDGSGPVSRRTALGLLGAGALALTGWWASTGDGGGGGRSAPPTAGSDGPAAAVAGARLVSRWPLREGFRDTVGDNHAEVRRGDPNVGRFDGRSATGFGGSVGVMIAEGPNPELSLLASGGGPGTIAGWVYFDRAAGGRDAQDGAANHHLFRKDAEFHLAAGPADVADAVELSFVVHGQQDGGSYRTGERTDDELLVRTGEWHHVAVVVDPAESLTVYVDGGRRFHDDGMDATSPTVERSWAHETIGSWYGTNAPGWYDLLVGKLADLRIYDDGLSDDEVARIHANTA